MQILMVRNFKESYLKRARRMRGLNASMKLPSLLITVFIDMLF